MKTILPNHIAKRVLAIDPGPEQSAYIGWNGSKLIDGGIVSNADMRIGLVSASWACSYDLFAIEMVACYGMAVGKEVFDTCLWIGRFAECSPKEPRLVYRRDVKLHHCQSARAKDSNIRQALIDKYGPPGTKKAPGKTYGLKSHLWAAFAIATFITETAQPDSSDAVQSPDSGSRPKAKSGVVVMREAE
jgi:hypothetical protein